jgi:ornithine cyclodeaminase/alanine dehydrogenase-like protein (mu-crystallin family)
MSPLFLEEDDVAGLVTVAETIDVLASAFERQAGGGATTLARRRLAAEGVFLHMLAGAVPGYFGYKTYATGKGKPRFYFHLFDSSTAEMVAVMQADVLGQIRTGAATGLATRLLAGDRIRVATIFGAGWQARSQLLAMDAVREMEKVWIVNRTPEKARAFIEAMAPQVRAALAPASSAEAAVRESQLVTTITGSREPVLFGKWLEPGTHVNGAGGNMILRREVDSETIFRSDRIVVDSIEQAKIEGGELIPTIGHGRRHWDEVVELKDVVNGYGGRGSESEITFFKSQGVGLEDVALGAVVYERARDRGIGRQLDI